MLQKRAFSAILGESMGLIVRPRWPMLSRELHLSQEGRGPFQGVLGQKASSEASNSMYCINKVFRWSVKTVPEGGEARQNKIY